VEKEEILKRIREENRFGDERQRQVQRMAGSNGLIVLSLIHGLLAAWFLFEDMVHGESLLDWRVFCVTVFLGFSIEFITKYYYMKKSKYLIGFLFFLVIIVMMVADILGFIF